MATFNTAFGSLPGTNDALGTNNNTKNPNQTAPKAQPAQPNQQTAQPAPAQTFAQMQAAGQARPAPMAAQPAQTMQAAAAPAPGGAASGADLRNRLLQTLSQMQGGQNAAAFQAQSAAKRADLESEFKTATQRLQEDLARRGLSASTFGANQEGSLMGNQARALASMEADLLARQAEMDAEERRASLSGLTNLTQLTTDMELRAQQMVQDAALQGRQLDLQAARDQVAKELGFGELGLKQQDLAQQREMEQARLEETRALRLQNLGISTRDLDLQAQKLQQDAALQGRQLDLQQARDLAEVDYRAKQLQAQNRGLDIEEARNLAQAEIDRDRNQISRDTLAEQTRSGDLDRQLREKLGLGQLEVDRLRATQEGRAFLVQLAQLIGVDKLTPDQLGALGLNSGATGAGSAGTGNTGGSGGSPAGGADTFF